MIKNSVRRNAEETVKVKRRHRLISIFLIILATGASALLLSSCRPYLPVNPKYSYADFSLELGEPIPDDIGEYIDLAALDKEDAEFARENTSLLLDGEEIHQVEHVDPGDHKLTIMYCGHQYRQYSFSVTDKVPPEFTRAEGLYTFPGFPIPEEELSGMFAAEDNSGHVTIELDSPDIDYNKAGKYKVTATATDSSGNTAQAEAVVDVQAPEYGAKGTYVYVSIPKQHLTYFVDSEPVLDTPVVTGNTHGHSTPTGTFSLIYKSRNTTLKGREDNGDEYESFVSYWMDFLGSSYGLHDATWRTNFGGDIYINSGSHGCVNMPYDAAGKLYGMIEPGTPILIY